MTTSPGFIVTFSSIFPFFIKSFALTDNSKLLPSSFFLNIFTSFSLANSVNPPAVIIISSKVSSSLNGIDVGLLTAPTTEILFSKLSLA